MKINLLSSKVYNRIAAGEVVERPFSVVKELVENAIDANADSISIEIENGGISSIIITDNGVGIEKSQLDKAMLPHATSKISNVTDLDNIETLGFRGEALASIASVSKVDIISKPKEQELGAEISCYGGEMGEVTDVGASDGTVITVKNIFFNTPVREKFLHSERSEENEISSVVARFILGHPDISFKYTSNGKTIYSSYGDGFESAMACVYGVDFINQCFYIDTDKNGIRINGYIGKHSFTKGNRSYQSIFVNGRAIVNQTISASIMNAYSHYLMKRQYPVYVLRITVPTEIVDVNVHPNKLDVRFSNNQIIYGTIYSVISKVLDGTQDALNIVVDNSTNNQQNSNDMKNDFITHKISDLSVTQTNEQINQEEKHNYRKLVFNDSGIPSGTNNDFSQAKGIGFDFDSIKKPEEKPIDIFAENKAFLDNLYKKQKPVEEVYAEPLCSNREFRYIGQVLNTYIIFEDGVDMYICDQHAAHERILFDKLNDSLRNSSMVTQPLLIPYVLNVNNEEYEFINAKIQMFNNLGVEISEFGRNSFKVSSIPSFMADMNLKNFFDDVLGDLNILKNLTINDVLMDRLAQKACKSAIKSGDKLSEYDIEIILGKLKENLGLKCPHGRPVAIRITRTEIDKWFKRIV